MKAPLALESLLQPLPGEFPCGESLRYDEVMARLSEARREDDTSLSRGVWQATPKRADWAEVEALAVDALARRSKDLMIAAYLGEAWLMRHGLAGFVAALGLIAGLAERFAESIHPQAEDGDLSWRAAPLEWMVERYTYLLHTRIPLAEAWPELFLFNWQDLQRRQVQASDNKADKLAAEAARQQRKQLDESVRNRKAVGWRAALEHLAQADRELQRIQAWGTTQLADTAPNLRPLRELLLILNGVYTELDSMAPEPISPALPIAEATLPEVAAELPTAPGALALGAPGDRREAYRQLLLIAEFLARTEPHSPVPYMIRRAVEWGDKPLSALLDELLNADAESRRVWGLLGVL